MKHFYLRVLALLLCAVYGGHAQIAKQSFEASGDTWSPLTFSTPPCTVGADRWNYASSLSSITPSDGAQFWGITDLNGNCGSSGFETISFPNINVSGYTSVALTFDYYVIGFDNNDDLRYEVFHDDVSQGIVVFVNGSGNFSTGGWVTETIAIPASVTNVRLELSARQNGGDYAGLDNVQLTGTAAGPNISATPSTLTNFTYGESNGPSTEQTFNVSGTSLNNAILITPPSNWEISTTSGGPYQTTAITLSETGGTVPSTTIYTRMVAGLLNVNAPFSGNITCSSTGAPSKTIAVDGTVSPQPPSNDLCSGAIALAANTSCSYASYTNESATDSGVSSPSCSNYNGGDVWFSIVVPASGELTIETEDNGGLDDTAIALYSGNCGALTELDCDDDSGAGTMSLLNATGLTPGDTVYIRVFDYGGNDVGTFNICVTTPSPCTAPTNQANALTLSNITGTSMDGNFTGTTADAYLIVASTSATLGAHPVDGTSYTSGDTLGSGTVIQNSNSTSFTATGLSQTTTYYFFVFAYNTTNCFGGPAFNTTNPLSGNDTTITGPCASESFNNAGNSSSYGTRNWTGDDGINWTATDARSDQDLSGDEAILLRSNGNGTLSHSTSFSGGCGVISFNYARVFSGSSTLQVWVNGTQYGGDITASSSSASLFTATVNIPGTIDVEIRNVSATNDKRALISNLSWSCYSGAGNPELQLVDALSADQNCGFSIDFGNQAIASTTAVNFAIENNGTADLEINSLGISGDFSIVSPTTPFSISTGNSQTVTLRFTPASTGTLNGTLTINNNDLDEGICIVNLTGEGFTPVPEIDVERNTNASIPSGNCTTQPANTGNNTLFAATDIGNTSSSKLYYIQNEGTADLTITALSLNNGTHFNILNAPSLPLTLSAGTNTTFEINFSPSTSGALEDIISISSNDSDEGTYTFCIGGTGNCPTSPLSISPSSGPVGTLVTITGSNFLGSTSATMNGTNTSVTIVSDTTLELNIPNGADSGLITITNNLGCVSTETFTVLENVISGCEGTGTLPTDLFISEVTDKGLGSHSYIEIFNGTGSSVNLDDYEVRIHHNGGAVASGSIPLSGTLSNNTAVTIGFGGSDAMDPEGGHTADFFGATAIGGINNDDHIRLYHNDGSTETWIDLWGDTSGSGFTVALSDYTYTRINSGITAPSTTWDSNDWTTTVPVDYSDIGVYDYSIGLPPSVSTQPTAINTCELSATLTVLASEGYNGPTPPDTKELNYQWYYSAPGDNGWTQVPDNTTFDNVTTATLHILNTYDTSGYQFYCQIREDDATCYTTSQAVLVNTQKTTWDGSSWDNGTPDSSTIAIINGNYDSSLGGDQSHLEACSLIVENGALLDIKNGTYANIQNDVVVRGTLRVQTHGALVQVNDNASFRTEAGGTSEVIKETELLTAWYEYTYWSSPVAAISVNNAFPDTPTNRRFWFNAANYEDATMESGNNNGTVAGQDDIDDNGDDWQIASGSSTMSPGLGYAATSSPLGMYPGSDQVTFSGAFNNGIVTVPIVINSNPNDNDWNFIGNPYASALDFNAFFAANSSLIQGAAFLWSHASAPESDNNGNEGTNFNQTDYAMITVGSGNTAGGSGVIPNTGNVIPSGQGFFVVGTANGSVTFNNSMRMADTNSNSQFFSPNNASSIDPERLWVNLTTDTGIFNQILMAYVDGATNGYDGMAYDATRNLSTGLAAIIYTFIEDTPTKKYAIQGKHPSSLNATEVIRVGFKTTIDSPTLYTFSVAQIEGAFLTDNPIYLRDHVLNTIHDLSSSDYTFTSDAGEFNNRFEILFDQETLSDHDFSLTDHDLSIVELSDGHVTFKVSGPHSMTSIEVIDLMGRTLYKLHAEGQEQTVDLSAMRHAPYMVKVQLTNSQTLIKKAVKRH